MNPGPTAPTAVRLTAAAVLPSGTMPASDTRVVLFETSRSSRPTPLRVSTTRIGVETWRPLFPAGPIQAVASITMSVSTSENTQTSPNSSSLAIVELPIVSPSPKTTDAVRSAIGHVEAWGDLEVAAG